MNPAMPRAQAALVRNGRIVHVGSNAEVSVPGVPRFDAGNRTVLPGFFDSHTHLDKACWFYAGLTVQLTYPRFGSLAQMYAHLREVAAQRPAGHWIYGLSSFSFNQLVDEKRYPTREELDAVSDRHPVAIGAGTHFIMMNTLAFKATGLWDPEQAAQLRFRDGRLRKGSDVARDANGVPTGVTTETYDLLPGSMYTIEERREAVRSNVVPNFVAKGITSLVNFPATLQDLPIDHELQADGQLPVRPRTFYVIPQVFRIDSLIEMGLPLGGGHDMWRFGGVKVFVAGAGADAHLKRLTDLKWTQDELNDMLWHCHSNGYQVLMHEAGHESFDMAVNAVEYAQRKQQRDLRHRLDHYAQLESLEEMRRVKRLGMRVAITAPAVRGAARAGATTPRYATLIREGLEPVSISDTTGTIPDFAPLRGMAAIVAPQSEGGSAPDGEAPSFEEAVRMWTIWAARSMFEEQDKGSIATGKLGDFAVLNGDAETHSGGALFDLSVDATILGGKIVYQR